MMSCNDANFILTGGIGGCHNDNVDAANDDQVDITLHAIRVTYTWPIVA